MRQRLCDICGKVIPYKVKSYKCVEVLKRGGAGRRRRLGRHDEERSFDVCPTCDKKLGVTRSGLLKMLQERIGQKKETKK
jgi:hypothetical protein